MSQENTTSPAGNIRARMDRLQRLALVVGGGGLGLTILIALVSPATAMPAYLVGYVYWVGIALGCLALTSIYHLVGGSWGVPVRRIMEAGGVTIIPLAVLFLPIALGMGSLYPWTDASYVAEHHAVAHKAAYLNTGFFLIRALIYFLIWSGIALTYRGLSLRQDQLSDQRSSSLLRGLAGPFLTLLFLSWTFGSIDWMMSREPEWSSTIWAYMSFAQFLIIWAGNLPEEIPYYLRRGRGAATWIALALAIFHFFVPFFILLIRQNKRRARSLATVAAWMLAMRWLDLCWVNLPAASEPGNPSFPWMQMALSLPALAGVGGISVAAFLTLYKTRPWIPLNDPRINTALEHSGG